MVCKGLHIIHLLDIGYSHKGCTHCAAVARGGKRS